MSHSRMELLATRDDKQIWFQEVSRPYQLDPPFPGELYVCILFVNDETISAEEQQTLSAQIISSDCRYAVCAGHKCSTWDDSIDMASLVAEDFENSDEAFVMTTWHENDSVKDVMFYGLMNTMFGEHEFHHYLVLFIGSRDGLREEVQRAIQSIWYERRVA